MSTTFPESTLSDVQAVAEAEVARRTQLQQAMLIAIVAAWSTIDPARIMAEWIGSIGARIFAAIALTQETMATLSPDFIDLATDVGPGPRVRPAVLDPLAFSGVSYEDLDMQRVLALAPIRAVQLRAAGMSDAEALARSLRFLQMVAVTETADAGRAADQVALIGGSPDGAEPTQQFTYGWVRVIEPGACARCAVLAGKFYKWNAGFERHPNCRCIHVPATVAAVGTLATDPKAYFDGLSPAERTRLFGKAVSQAIEAGADMNRVVNAATKGKVSIAGDGTRTKGGKPTPWQLIKDAAGDRAEAVRLLTQFGYIRA